MSPVGRRESRDAWHQAQKLQATRQELLVWAQRLRAEVDARSAPSSPAEAWHRLEEQRAKGELFRPWTFPGIPLPLYPLPYCDPNFLSGPFSVTCLCLSLPFHPLSCLPTSPPSHWASSSPEGPSLWDLSPVLLQAELDSWTDSISLARSTGW